MHLLKGFYRLKSLYDPEAVCESSFLLSWSSFPTCFGVILFLFHLTTWCRTLKHINFFRQHKVHLDYSFSTPLLNSITTCHLLVSGYFIKKIIKNQKKKKIFLLFFLPHYMFFFFYIRSNLGGSNFKEFRSRKIPEVEFLLDSAKLSSNLSITSGKMF